MPQRSQFKIEPSGSVPYHLGSPEQGSRMESFRDLLALDVVDDVLHCIRVQSIVYSRSIIGAPWGFWVNAKAVGSFTLVREGGCWLEVEGVDKGIWLERGEAAVLPYGHAHSYRDDPSSKPIPLIDLLVLHPLDPADSTMRFGGPGEKTVLICGAYWFEERKTNPLLAALPIVIHIGSGDKAANPSIGAAMEAIEAEVVNTRPGSHTVVARWAEILFLHALRLYIEKESRSNVGWISALRDPHISRVLSAMHRAPERSWSIAQLASDAGMSRSAFAERFSALVGETPMHYLTRLRMNKAAGLLKLNRAKLVNIAEAVGYESETAFNKAFKRWVGVSPGAYRESSVDLVAMAMSSRAQ
jgi:AraC-like DNA-binding protein